MTRKDFELIADTLRKAREAQDNEQDRQTVDRVSYWFSGILGGTNSRFDGHRFLNAAGVEVKCHSGDADFRRCSATWCKRDGVCECD